MYIDNNGNFYEADGSIPVGGRVATTEEIASYELNKAVPYFKSLTDKYIQDKVIAWNQANAATGIEFDGITSFPKYAVIPTDTRHAISVQFLTWNGKIWDAVRAFQATATTVPTDVEFKAVLDSVVF